MRLYTIRIYFKDTPHPWTFKDISNLSTEGAFLRLVSGGKSQWLPIENIFRIQEVEKVEV